MKKSTLITTIAMIVVVVVALSTATYAWFSSSTNSVAETSITTTSSVDWLMVKGSVTVPATATTAVTSTNATFSTTASDTIQMSNAMAGGLFAPTNEIQTSPSNALTSVISDLPVFYSAKVNNTTSVVTAGVVYDSVSAEAAGALSEGHGAVMLPEIIKVSNGTRQNKTLKLTVIVNAGATQDSTATIYAAAATSFYAAWQPVDGASASTTATAGTATNGYKWKAGATPDTAFANITTTTVEKSNNVTGTKPTYNGDNTVAGWTTNDNDAVSSEEAALNIAASESYIKYEITIGQIGVGDAVYVMMYTWIDGWVAEANAAGASYKVTYAFTSAS